MEKFAYHPDLYYTKPIHKSQLNRNSEHFSNNSATNIDKKSYDVISRTTTQKDTTNDYTNNSDSSNHRNTTTVNVKETNANVYDPLTQSYVEEYIKSILK